MEVSMLAHRTTTCSPTIVYTPSRLWGVIFAALILIIILGLVNIFVPTLQANHRDARVWWHQANMHSNAAGEEEAVCVISASTHVSHASFRSNVQAKLYVDNPSQDWHQLGADKI